MNEITTIAVMVLIFCIIGVALPVFLMIRDETKNPQSALPNKLILWIPMVFCMILILGIVVNFQGLSETIRSDIIRYGFIALMLFGMIFGIDQLFKSKDLTVETQEDKHETGGLQESDDLEPKSGNINVE